MTLPVAVALVDSGTPKHWTDYRIHSATTCFDANNPFAPQLSMGGFDENGHGTLCARYLLAANSAVSIKPVRVFDRRLVTSTRVLVNAIEWICRTNIQIVNLSLATRDAEARAELERTVHKLFDKPRFVIAAFQNGLAEGMPAEFDAVIGVRVAEKGAAQLTVAEGTALVLPYAWTTQHLQQRSMPPLTRNSAAAAYCSGVVSRLLEMHAGISPDELTAVVANALNECGHPAV